MTLVKAANNTNTNTNPAIVSHTGFFPKSTVKSSGQGYTTQNTRCGEFTGIIKALRPIKSAKNPTVFGVIDIEVEGEQGVFQDYLNFNPDKEVQTMNYLVNHTKSILTSAGYEANPDDEKDMDWVQQTLTELVEAKAKVTFNQTVNARGLSINYL